MNDRPPFVPENFKGRCKVFPKHRGMFLDYQTRWILDNSRLKLLLKSRQVGATFCTAYRVVRETSTKSARNDTYITSRDEPGAMEFLLDVKRFANLFSVGVKDLGQEIIDQDGHTAHILRFSNGLRVHSMSSNPDAQAGRRGTRIIDEAALHADPRKMYTFAVPGTTWGGTVSLISTPRGSQNYFNELVREITERDNPKGFSFHKVSLEDALNAGLLFKIQSKLEENNPQMQMTEDDYFSFVRASCADEESFQQEYCCVPSDDNSAFLSYQI